MSSGLKASVGAPSAAPPSATLSSPPDDLPPSTRLLVEILGKSLERQATIAERTADRVDNLGERVDRMGDRIATEVSSAMRWQLKIIGGLVALAIILLGSATGVSFMGSGYGITVGTSHSDDEPGEIEEEEEDPTASIMRADRELPFVYEATEGFGEGAVIEDSETVSDEIGPETGEIAID